MATKQLDRMNHVAISVADIAAAVDWYTTNFSCNVLYQDDTWAFLEFANMKVALVLPKQHASHVAFEKDDLASYGEVRTHRDGVRYVYLKDPFGNTVEVVDR